VAENEKPRAPDLPTVLSEMFRAVVRPAITIIFAAGIAQLVVEGRPVPDWFLALAIPIITWWFAERTVGHIKNKNGA
jgi:hypothetical protein